MGWAVVLLLANQEGEMWLIRSRSWPYEDTGTWSCVSNVCVSYLFILFINEGQYLCMCFCFLYVHFVICLWGFFLCLEICLVSQDFQTCWAKRLTDSEPSPKAHISVAYHARFSCMSAVCHMEPVSVSFPWWFLCGYWVLNFLLVFWTSMPVFQVLNAWWFCWCKVGSWNNKNIAWHSDCSKALVVQHWLFSEWRELVASIRPKLLA